jgi:hypothetical protein
MSNENPPEEIFADTNQPLGAGVTLIKKDHIEELRMAVK